MKSECIALVAFAVLAFATPAMAAEGAATGNGTSTLAGPAGDNKGPTKSHSMSSGHHMKKMKHRKSM